MTPDEKESAPCPKAQTTPSASRTTTPDPETNPLPDFLRRLAELVHLDFAPRHRHPSPGRLLLAMIASVAGSVIADALLVVIGVALFPSTKGYTHFRFADYSKLTVIGVLIACVAWPITTRINSQPQ